MCRSETKHKTLKSERRREPVTEDAKQWPVGGGALWSDELDKISFSPFTQSQLQNECHSTEKKR